MEAPREGLRPEAGFTIVVARKIPFKEKTNL
jgi:hypothetical protein